MKKIVLLILLVPLLTTGQVNLSNGLVAYYPFNGNANDVSGNGNNPSDVKVSFIKDRLGKANSACRFDGKTNYIRIPDAPSLHFKKGMTISAWVKVTDFYEGPCHGNRIIMKGYTDHLNENYFLTYDDNHYTNGSNCYTAKPDKKHQLFYGPVTAPVGNNYILPGKWYLLTYTYDGLTANLYLDCKVIATGTARNHNFSNTDDLFFGKLDNSQFPYWFNGELDEVRIYNRCLNQNEVTAIVGDCQIPIPCNNWLRTQAAGQSVTVGDLDISGDKITIEANFNCTSFPLSGINKWQDIVSKHSNTTDINYALRMDLAAITTTTGAYRLSSVCDNLVPNKTYHVAMVYDGVSLKFFRNGFLMGQMAATGNLILNNWMTTIGDYAITNNPVGTNFMGYINEVRIWNVPRTETQLQSYMNTSLPDPTKHKGLLAYYTFDNLLNKQGNAAWNGTLNRGAKISQVNTSCKFIPDRCNTNECVENKPSAKFSYYVSNCIEVNFRLKEKSKEFKSVKWLFGDGSSSDKLSPEHNYKKYGTYKVKAIVTNKAGCSDTVTNEVKLQGLKTDFVFTEQGEPGRLLFKAKNNKASYSWNFADGNLKVNETVVTHTYSTSGKYGVSMFAKNSIGCTDTVQKTVFISLPEIITDKPLQPDTVLTAPIVIIATPFLDKREKELVKNIAVDNDSLLVSVYDNGIIDGDSVTLVFNNNVITTHQLLSSKPLNFSIKIDKNIPNNELMMYAENLGSIPPNTSLMIIYDGSTRHQLNISSSKKSNGTVSFTLRNRSNL
jgi:PKD repeat protein